MLSAGLSASGLRTGRFLSPHVERFEERVAVDGQLVSARRVAEFVALVRRLQQATPVDPDLQPAFFEYTLALALSEFARAGAEAAVLEAGVGGGADATRAVDPVRLTVITNVDLDHLDVLGPTLLDVARDKAGAIRPGGVAVSGATQPEVRRLLQEVADELGAKLFLEGGTDPALFALPAPLQAAALVAGSHSRTPATRSANARVAAAALRLLGAGEAAVEEGLRVAPLPGRGERFLLPAAHGEVLVILDGAHDEAATQRLRDDLTSVVGASPYVLLFGALARKQGQRCLELLAPAAQAIYITDAAPAEWGGGSDYAWPGAVTEPAAAAALNAALETADKLNAALVVSGSLYLAGAVRPLLRERGQRLEAPWEQVPAKLSA